MSFPRYAEYKDSGVTWLGEVPAHWRFRRTKFLFDIMSRSPKEDDEIVTCFRDGVVTLRSNRRTEGFTNSEREIGYQGVRIGDLVIHAMDAFAGAIGVSDSNGKSTPVYSVCRPRSDEVSANYYGRLLRHMALSGFVSSLAKGIRERSTEFRWKDAGDLALPLPSREEQDAISRFLDHETAKIDALVAEQEKLIALLKEKRQAVISHAVTKGLDPEAPMKDSGIEWLGEVPAHWDRAQIGRVCRQVSDGPHFSPNYVDDGVMFLSARNIGVESWYLDDAKFVSEDDYVEFCKRVIPEKGDVLYTKGGTTGIARVVDIEERFQVWVHVAILKLYRDMVDPYFLAYSLNSVGCYEQSQLHTRGATNQDLGLTRMTKIWFALPPLSEQFAISKFLDLETARFDELMAEATTAMSLLKERRAALISAAVTGKIDVREFA